MEAKIALVSSTQLERGPEVHVCLEVGLRVAAPVSCHRQCKASHLEAAWVEVVL